MKTVDKAFAVLDQFSLSHREIGLSEMSRMAGLDKAATRRLLVAMAKHGFIEQVADTRKYRLGHGFLRLARLREATVPVTQAAQEAVDWLVQETNETAHASLPGAHGMTTIAFRLPNRGRVINIVPGEVLLYHATASGMAYLSVADDVRTAEILALDREKKTPATITSKAKMIAACKEFRAQGYALVRSSFELDVAGLATTFFQSDGTPMGSIALAMPESELTETRRKKVLPLVKAAAKRIEVALGGDQDQVK